MKKHRMKIGLSVTLLAICHWSAAKGNVSKENKQEFSVMVTKPISLSGYTQVRYRARDDNNDSFDIRRARLSLKGKINKPLSYKLQTEFGGSSQKLLDAELTFNLHSMIKISAGQFKIPLSRENLMSSSKLVTINRSQVVEALAARSKDVLGNQSGRDIGLKLNGSVNVITEGTLIDYTIGLFNGSGINTADLNERKDIGGRLTMQLVKQITLGGSFYSGKYTPNNALDEIHNHERIGAELFYNNSLISFTTEYMKGKDGSTEKAGWYIQAGCFLFSKNVQGIVRYDTYDPDMNISNSISTVYTLGVNFFFDKQSKIQINYELKDEEPTEKNSNSFITQIQFGF